MSPAKVRAPTPQHIARRRLASQHLIKPTVHDPAEVVRRLGAVQSQDYAGAKWGVGLRGAAITNEMVERALTDGTIIRTHVLRPTWHFMAADDARWILALTGPRVHAANSHYSRKLELDDALFRKSAKILTKALAGGKHLTREELDAALAKGGITSGHPQRLAYLMMHAELNAVICSGPRRGNQFTYALFDERVPPSKPLARDEALAELARRYFATRGPATVPDFAWWSGLTIADAKKATAMLGSEITQEQIGGVSYWFCGAPVVRASRVRAVHLLPNYDEFFIGFKDRSAILTVVKGFSLVPGDPMFTSHVVVLDGQLIGGWKRTVTSKAAAVEIELLSRPVAPVRRALLATAKRYGELLGVPVEVTGHD
ncbi:MAG: winged helix DNA-binding domain-containing protein [bacterium]